MIPFETLSTSVTRHNQGGLVFRAMKGATLTVAPGLSAGRSTLIRRICNYVATSGRILVGDTDVARAAPRDIILPRRETLGYVRQFLRVVPRVSTVDVVAEPLRALGVPCKEARHRAEERLAQLTIPKSLWSLSPTTFSGGEQQRVTIARGFVHAYPALLPDEPTASLDAPNRDIVLGLIKEAKARGAAIIGIFCYEAARASICYREIDVSRVSGARAA